MANVFKNPAQVATMVAKLVEEETLLSSFVSKQYVNEFLGPGTGGAPIAIKVPTTLIARDRDIDDVTSSLVLDEIAEATKTLNLDKKMDYSAVGLSEADLNLNIVDFSAQVLQPQAAAVVDKVEQKVVDKLKAVPETELLGPDGAPIAFDPSEPTRYLTRIRQTLRKNGVPTAGINMIVGTEVYAALLDSKALEPVDASGSPAALRDANVGRVRGFNVIENTRVEDGEILAFHRDAVTLVTRAPAVPLGASFGQTISGGGLSMRYLRDYDAMKTQDRSIVATFSGVGILPTYKVTRDYETRTVKVDELANGGVLRLDTSEVTV